MDTRILDATGHGSGAKVDGQNRMWTYSVDSQMTHYESVMHGNAWLGSIIKYTDVAPYLVLTTTGGPVFIINNKTTNFLVMNRLMGVVTASAQFWMHSFNTIQTPTANHRSLVAKNLNFGVSPHTGVEIFGWNGTDDGMTGLTLSDNSAINSIFFPAAAAVDMIIQDSWVLPPNASLVVSTKRFNDACFFNFTMAGFMLSGS